MRVIALAFSLTIFLECCFLKSKNTLYDKIDQHLSEIESTHFLIDIANFVPASWDQMFVFDYTVNSLKIDQLLGFKYTQNSEFTDKIIFVLKDSIVYKEEIPVNFNGIDENGGGLRLIFMQENESRFYQCSRTNSTFKAIKGENPWGETVYYLKKP